MARDIGKFRARPQAVSAVPPSDITAANIKDNTTKVKPSGLSYYFNTLKRCVGNHKHSLKGHTDLLDMTHTVDLYLPCETLKGDNRCPSDPPDCTPDKGLSPIGLALLVDVRRRGLNVNVRPRGSTSSHSSTSISLSDYDTTSDTHCSTTPTFAPISPHNNELLESTELSHSTERILEGEEDIDIEESYLQTRTRDAPSPHVWLTSLPFAHTDRLQNLHYRSKSLARTTSGLCLKSNELAPTPSDNYFRSYSNTSDRYLSTNHDSRIDLRKLVATRSYESSIRNNHARTKDLSELIRNTSSSSRRSNSSGNNEIFKFE